jgi:hydrogenase nickel incorporation protein HypB
MFQKADLVLITKIDLLPVLPQIRVETIRENLSLVMPSPRVLPISAATGEGVDAWIAWLRQLRVPRASSAVIVGAL